MDEGQCCSVETEQPEDMVLVRFVWVVAKNVKFPWGFKTRVKDLHEIELACVMGQTEQWR